MSPRSIYLRDQADKCRRHAENIGDADTQEQLRILAAEYIMSAVAIESEEPNCEARIRPPQMPDASTQQIGALQPLGMRSKPAEGTDKRRPPRPRIRLS
jgi:hypothetical protein